MGSKTYVSSVAYPLGAEKLEDRVDYLQYTTLNAILTGRDLSPAITRGYLTGPGINYRNAYRYARDHYVHGLPNGNMVYNASPDRAAVTAILASLEDPGAEIYLSTATIMVANFQYWAERYLAETYGYDRIGERFTRPPDGVDADAVVAYDVDRGGTIRILLINNDSSIKELSYKPKDLNSGRLYLHTMYQVVREYPTEITSSERPTEAGDSPGSSTATVTVERDNEVQETRTTTTITVVDGVTKTMVEKLLRTMSRMRYYFYQLGSGVHPSLDALLSTNTTAIPFYPSIPLRVDNVDVSAESRKDTELYKTSKKLLKLTGTDYEDLAEKLRTNKDIKEIDFAFIQFGVALNTEMPEGKKYIFRFLKMLQNLSAVSRSEVTSWNTQQGNVASEMENTAGDPTEGGTKVPWRGFTSSGYSSPPSNRLTIRDTDQAASSLHLDLEWLWVETEVKAGTVAPSAKVDQCTVGWTGAYSTVPFFDDAFADQAVVYVRKQLTAGTYEEVRICGFTLVNHVYRDKTIEISAYKALTDRDEEGFILPLSYQIFREMGMREGTQLSYECQHMVLNCYKVVKKKWYQTGLFKIVAVIVAIVIAVVTWGAGSAVSTGIIGAVYGAVASVIGAGLLAYLIAQAIVSIAIMLLMKLLTPALVDLFGEKWGRVLAAIVTIVVSIYAGGGNLSSSFGSMNATTIINATSAVSQIAGAYAQGAMIELDIPGTTKKLAEEYTLKMDEIEKLTREFLKPGSELIDIQGYIDATAVMMEAPGVFLQRTLLTGSDIVALTHAQIDNFTDVGLLLPNTG